MRSRITAAAAVELCVQFSIISAVFSYNLKNPSTSIEYNADSAVEGDIELYRFTSPKHQPAVGNIPKPENKHESKFDVNVEKLMDRNKIKSSTHAGGEYLASEILMLKKASEGKSGEQQTQTGNFQKEESLTPNRKVFCGLLLAVRHLQSLTELSLVTNFEFFVDADVTHT
jgi:hypothetical protein